VRLREKKIISVIFDINVGYAVWKEGINDAQIRTNCHTHYIRNRLDNNELVGIPCSPSNEIRGST
jgi:hypothetical protein